MNNMAWVYLFIASFGEIFGVMLINIYLMKKDLRWLLALIATFSVGFLFLSLAMQEIQMGTAYAIWTGVGAAGAVIMGILFFNESAGWKRMFFLACIISGAVGLKVFG